MHCRYGAAVEAAERAWSTIAAPGWPYRACLGDSLAAGAQRRDAQPRPRGAAGSCSSGADLGGEANVLPSLAELEAMRGRFAEARRLVARARMLYEPARPARARRRSTAAPIEGRSSCSPATVAAAERALRAAARRSSGSASLSYLATRAAELADAVYWLGRLRRSRALGHRAEELGAPDDVLTQILWRTLRAKLLARQGRLVEAEELVGEATRAGGDD